MYNVRNVIFTLELYVIVGWNIPINRTEQNRTEQNRTEQNRRFIDLNCYRFLSSTTYMYTYKE